MMAAMMRSACAMFLVGLVGGAFAQTANTTYKVRLAPVAMDLAMRENIQGAGAVTATLAGSKLTIAGTFAGLTSNATVASIRQGSATGVRGPKLLDLSITKGFSGNLNGVFELTPDQLQALRQGKWYVQIDSEKAPEGNLWGWLVK